MTRIFHPWHKWECFRAGLYETCCPDGYTNESAKAAYRDFLADLPRFDSAIRRVLTEWPHSCQQFLTNDQINRVAWLGQASMCMDTGVPAIYRGGFSLLTPRQQNAANILADSHINKWLEGLSYENLQSNAGVSAQMELAGLSC